MAKFPLFVTHFFSIFLHLMVVMRKGDAKYIAQFDENSHDHGWCHDNVCFSGKVHNLLIVFIMTWLHQSPVGDLIAPTIHVFHWWQFTSMCLPLSTTEVRFHFYIKKMNPLPCRHKSTFQLLPYSLKFSQFLISTHSQLLTGVMTLD